MNNLIKNKKGDLDVRKTFLLIGFVGILISFVYLVMAAPADLTSVVLNSTTSNNYTSENITVYTDQDSNSSLRLIYDWRKEGNSIAIVNMPFDANTTTSSTPDFSGVDDIPLILPSSAPPTYNSTFGFKGGSLHFTGDTGDERITIVGNSSSELYNLANEVTVSMWVYPEALSGDGYSVFYQEYSSNTERYQFGIKSNNELYLYDDIDDGGATIASGYNLIFNQWYHIAVVGKGSNWKIYVNGTLVKDQNQKGIGSMTHADSKHYFGLRHYTKTGDNKEQEFRGFMDEAMIFNRALSPEQISALYNNQSNLIVSQETIYGDSWKSCVTPVEGNESGTTTCSNSLSVANISVILNSTDVSTNYSTDNLTAYVSNLASGDKAIYDWKVDGSSIMLVNMPMDGGALCSGKVCDYSDGGSNGSFSGVVYNATGGYNSNGAYEFDGDYSHINFTLSQSNLEDFTIALWVKTVNVTPSQHLVTQSGTATDFFYISSGFLRSSDCAFNSNFSLDTNWHHLVYSRDYSGNVINYYIDGVLDNSNSCASSTEKFTFNRLGIEGNFGGVGGQSLNGTMDEILIFDRELTPEQISAMYNGGSYRANLILSSETLTDEDWQACVTANTGEGDGKEVCSSVLTVMADMTLNTSVNPHIVTNGSSVTLDMSVLTNVSAINFTWANLTYPNTTVLTINSFPYVFNDTNTTGRYNVTFFANDTSGDRVSNDDYFESFEGVTFNFTIIDFETTGVDSSWELYYRDEIIRSNSSSAGTHSSAFPDALSDLKVKSYSDRLQITLTDINVTLENGKNFGMDKLSTPATGYLVTYGVNNSYSFTNAIVRIYYDDLSGSISDEANLQLWKCDDYNFTGQSCSGTWGDVTSSSTQNTGSDYFEYNATSFSGFSIKQYVVSVTTTTTTSEGGGGGLACKEGYKYINGTCVEISEEIPEELFDITWNLEDYTIVGSNELTGIITFESFGNVPTFVDLIFIIKDEFGKIVYREENNITVTTEEVLRWKYENLEELPEGEYTAILETLYNTGVSDEFKQRFKVGKEVDLLFDIKRNWVWYLSGLVATILLVVLVWWLIKRFRNVRRKKSISFEGKVSKILQGAKVK